MLMSIHQSVLDKRLVAKAGSAPNGITLFESSNWAGYIALPGGATTSFKQVSSYFTVPSANCSAGGVGTGDAFAYHWIGLDGWSSGTVEQDGVGVLCEGGSPTYIAWWETFPGALMYNTDVSPGDQINASVTFNGSDYVMTVKDITQGTTPIKATEPCESGSTCANSSAEAITEGYPSSPWLGTADYGASMYSRLMMTNQAGTTGPVSSSSWTDAEAEAVQGSTITSQPGGLYSAGTGTAGLSAFEIFWKAVS
jgi:Peptidase A4 family